jgi:hypothetical protein
MSREAKKAGGEAPAPAVTAPWRTWRRALGRLLVLYPLGVLAAAVELDDLPWEVESGEA